MKEMKEEKLLTVLNKMIKVLDPIKFEDMNMDFTATDQAGLLTLEVEHTEVGIKDKDNGIVCSSVAALIATITDILVEKRLAFQIDDEGIIKGFQWYANAR